MHNGYKQDKGLEQELAQVFESHKAVGTIIRDTEMMEWYPREFEDVKSLFLPEYNIFPTIAGARVTVMHIRGG